MRYDFDWDPIKERINARKHGLSFRQAAFVFRDPQHLSIYDDDHSENEDRWITIGFDNRGVLRVVVHTFEKLAQESVKIRIISARTATKAEQKQYIEANS